MLWAIVGWLIVGLIAGWIASAIMGSRLGIVGDVVIGLIGAVVGGWLFSALFDGGTSTWWGSILVAILGAVILLAILRAFTGRRTA